QSATVGQRGRPGQNALRASAVGPSAKWRRTASSLLSRDWSLGTHLRKGRLRDQQRLAHQGRADIAEQVQNSLRELVFGPAVVERKADMQFQLRGPPRCGVGDDADHRPGLEVEPGPRPQRAEDGLL